MLRLKSKVRKICCSLVLSVILISCSTSFGDKYEVGNLEIFHTKNVGIEYVEKVGEYFEKNNLIGETKQSLQLTADTAQFLLRIVSLEEETEESKENLKLLEEDLANTVFKDRNFKIQLCDAFFNPKKG